MAGEPEEVNRFQREMSLNWTGGRGSDARVNERHRAERRTTDVGPDRGVCGGESEDWFSAPKGEARYEFIERILKSQQYRRLSCGQKGIVRRSSSPNQRTTRVLAARDSARTTMGSPPRSRLARRKEA